MDEVECAFLKMHEYPPLVWFQYIDDNPSRPNPGRREKNLVKFSFSHFFVVPQKVI